MGTLIYGGIASLDGYIADPGGRWDWAVPDEEVLRFCTALDARTGTYLYGRTTYELMASWETLDEQPEESAGDQDFAAMWQQADKIVYSTTLPEVTTARTTLRRHLDVDEVRRLKAEVDHDMSISGPGLAATAIHAGLVDEWQVFLVPAVVGGGLRLVPDGSRVDLTLVEQRTFGNGTIFLRYVSR